MLFKKSSKSCPQASHFALIKFSFAYFKQPKQIFLLKMEPSLDPFFAFFKQFNFYGGLGIKSIKGYQPAPAALLVSLMNTVLLAMKLTSTTTFKETRMTVL